MTLGIYVSQIYYSWEECLSNVSSADDAKYVSYMLFNKSVNIIPSVEFDKFYCIDLNINFSCGTGVCPLIIRGRNAEYSILNPLQYYELILCGYGYISLKLIINYLIVLEVDVRDAFGKNEVD